MRRFLIIFLLTGGTLSCFAKSENKLRYDVSCWVKTLESIYQDVGEVRLERVKIFHKRSSVEIYLNEVASYLLYRENVVQRLYHQADSVVHRIYPKYKVSIFSNTKKIEFYVPNYRRVELQYDKSRFSNLKKTSKPLVRNLSIPYEVTHGLAGKNLALWSSHGMYYNQQQDRWCWQRARLFSTVEDKLTLTYVLNFLLPMLENAGANVLLPHERDCQLNEVIVDNDASSNNSRFEALPSNIWMRGGNSAYALIPEFIDLNCNPFKSGTYLFTKATRKTTAFVRWVANIPETGNYAVYVAFQSKENSIEDASYTVCHAAGETTFVVNQQQGGGTWIYLGNFFFKKGINPSIGSVVLTNHSESNKGIVSADAVRFGGGMGNVARKPADAEVVAQYNQQFNKKVAVSPFVEKTKSQVSGVPRYLEAARYWLQAAGFDSKIFSRTQGVDDYVDDIAARGLWVNALNFGSINAPDSVGLSIPIDLALGFHTDAGLKSNDTIIGSLGIFTAKESNKYFPNGQSRYASREFSDRVLMELNSTITKHFNIDWKIRGLWNKSYLETRLPNVPTMLLELLSHQNPTDLRYALDPHFQFATARAIYKAILKYLSFDAEKNFVVQPLPINSFHLKKQGDSVQLCWRPSVDTLCVDNAIPTGYVVYVQEEDQGFNNGIYTSDTTMNIFLKPDVLYQFKVAAVNAGGKSFDSQTLSACFSSDSQYTLIIVNGFDRLAAPDFFEVDKFGGIKRTNDFGVPYKKSYSFTGSQYEFSKESPWISDDNPGFGASCSTYDTMSIAGNTFDYTVTHGKAIRQIGYSFVSSSRQAVEDSLVDLNQYKVVDLLLGKQRSTLVGLDSLKVHYKVISQKMQRKIADFCQSGGSLLVSGAHLTDDMCEKEDMEFLKNCFKIKHNTTLFEPSGCVVPSFSKVELFSDTIRYCIKPSTKQYHVSSVCALLPVDGAFEILRYNENGTIAATAYRNKNRLWLMGFPMEAIINENEFYRLMLDALSFLIEKNEKN